MALLWRTVALITDGVRLREYRYILSTRTSTRTVPPLLVLVPFQSTPRGSAPSSNKLCQYGTSTVL